MAPSAGGASAEELLARALVVIERQSAEVRELREENAQLREQNARLVRVNEELRELVGEQAARLAEANESLAVLQRMVFGRKSEKDRPEPPGTGAGDDPAGDGGGEPSGGGKKNVRRGPGARAGRRDYSHLPRVEVIWDFPAAGTAARAAGCRSRGWGCTCPGSSSTGRSWSRCGRTASAVIRESAGARGRRR